jgi:SAM-dependent methyltransferase
MQNKYDDPDFFVKYSQMSRSQGGLEAAGEWPVLRAMLPDLKGKRVLDLGCGYGWHCRYAREQQARSVMGVDISEKMLARAREDTHDPEIEYRQLAIEDIDFPPDSFDVVISSLAFHYVEQFETVCRKVYSCLVPSGAFVFSVEHPIYTALPAQDWYHGPNGERLHWPVDNYQDEGERQARFLESTVLKYHRTIATYFNALIDAGFTIKQVAEPPSTQEMLAKRPELRDELRRPIFLLISAVKSAVRDKP